MHLLLVKRPFDYFQSWILLTQRICPSRLISQLGCLTRRLINLLQMLGLTSFRSHVHAVAASSKTKELLSIQPRRLGSVFTRSTWSGVGRLLLLQFLVYLLMCFQIEVPHCRPVAVHALEELHVLLDHVLIRLGYFVLHKNALVCWCGPLVWLCCLGGCATCTKVFCVLSELSLPGMVHLDLKLALEVSS